MNASPARAPSASSALPLLAAGSSVLAFGLASPIGGFLVSAFAEGWLAVYLDGAGFRSFCF
jgi:hypothetical protein